MSTMQFSRHTPQSRLDFLRAAREVVKAVETGACELSAGAYQICGLSSHIRDELTPSDAEMVRIACDLELPESQRQYSTADWQRVTDYFDRIDQ